MEKQTQTLTSELEHLKNNQNKAINSKTENHSQQQSQTIRNENKSSQTAKHGVLTPLHKTGT